MTTSRLPDEKFIIRHATKIAVGVITLIMLFAGAVFWRQEHDAQASKEWVMHTYDVRGHIRGLTSSVKDAVMGQNGFVLTGNEEYLEPYNDAIAPAKDLDSEGVTRLQKRSVYQAVAILEKMTSDNPSQQANLNEAKDAIKKLMNYLAYTIKLRQDEGVTSIPKDDLLRGKSLIERVLTMMRVMEAEETHLLKTRQELDKNNAERNGMLLVAAMFVFYLVITASVVLYQRNRLQAQQQTLQYTRDLEVREEELKMQQEELKASNEEIEASNEELEEKTNMLEEQNAKIRQQSIELAENKRLVDQKAEELELSNRYKSEFLANMSHELRTPLNSLLILAKGLASNELGNLNEEQVEEAKVIHNGGLELLSLINDILDLSKVEAGKISIITENTYINDIVKRLSLQFEPIIKESGVAFQIRVENGLPDSLHTDGQRVDQILKNLLSNAFKFTEAGSVTLNIHRLGDDMEFQRSDTSSTGVVAFDVTDTGIGIDESKLKDIFEAFQQEDGSTDRHYGGTGLGLTIARKFAHLLGGEIHVKSRKGSGSTFTLLLPLLQSESNSTISSNDVPRKIGAIADVDSYQMKPMPKPTASVFIQDDRSSIGPNDKVLLIIEDDAKFAATLVKIARKRGYKCLAAGDGKNGLLLASEQSVTAIILDLMLPDMNGMRVLDQLKHSLTTRHIPVHIISGCDEPTSAKPLNKGAIGYLMKPAQQEELNEVFARIEEIVHTQVKKVLVIEDDKNTQSAIQSLLKHNGVEITVVGRGKAALEKLKQTRFDCIILDLKLPDMNGFEWLEALEKQCGNENPPPIVIYTAQELSEDETRRLSQYTGSIVIKGVSSSERLLDEVTLFLHSVESTLTHDQKTMIRMQHDPDCALQQRTVLLVDDDLRNTFAISKVLKKHGMNVIIADNGQMALDKLRDEPEIELVIMDIMMPIMDGYQAMREIRQNSLWQELPIIALTARAMPEEQDRCMEAGANDYLIKPVDVDRLLTLLRVSLFKQEILA